MTEFDIVISWQMWATMALVLGGVVLYATERFSIEATSVGIITVLIGFFSFFAPEGSGLDAATLLSGFADPALITIMALLVIGQGMFQTGALERPTMRINSLLESRPRQTLIIVFALAFFVSMFMNNTPIVVMFIPVLSAMVAQLRGSASRFMMPLSFICILAGMTTLIGSSTNLLVAGVLERSNDIALGFFAPTQAGLILAAIGALYIIIFSPILLPKRQNLEEEVTESGHQYIAQIKVTQGHPLRGTTPVAGLFPTLRDLTVRMIQRDETALLPPFEDPLREGDILIVAATRKSLASLLSSHPEYLEGMLKIAGFNDGRVDSNSNESIVIGETVIAPASRMIGRKIEQIGIRRQTGCLVLGIQRRSRMIRKKMLDIRLEAGDVLLLFGYSSDMATIRANRDLLLLDWATKELPDIRKALLARIIFTAVIIAAAWPAFPIVLAALLGGVAMIATGCLNIRQATRALDMKIFLLIGAAFSMGLALELTGGAGYMAMKVVETFQPFGPQVLIGALFIVIAIMTNLLSNSATALLFAPIALNISAQTGIDPILLVLTVIYAANCCFATPIAYQTNLLVMGPGRYNFMDFVKFGAPLVVLIWLTFIAIMPFMFDLSTL